MNVAERDHPTQNLLGRQFPTPPKRDGERKAWENQDIYYDEKYRTRLFFNKEFNPPHGGG